MYLDSREGRLHLHTYMRAAVWTSASPSRSRRREDYPQGQQRRWLRCTLTFPLHVWTHIYIHTFSEEKVEKWSESITREIEGAVRPHDGDRKASCSLPTWTSTSSWSWSLRSSDPQGSTLRAAGPCCAGDSSSRSSIGTLPPTAAEAFPCKPPSPGGGSSITPCASNGAPSASSLPFVEEYGAGLSLSIAHGTDYFFGSYCTMEP